MPKRAFAVIALAVLAVFAVPTAAFAATDVPAGNVSVSSGGTATPGEAITVSFTAGSFPDDGQVFVQCVGDSTASFGVVRAGTVSSTFAVAADGSGNFQVIIPEGATGSFNVTATGVQSSAVGTAVITVVAPDWAVTGSGGFGTGSDGLTGIGYNAPMLLIWGAAGALLLCIALLVVLNIVHRQPAGA